MEDEERDFAQVYARLLAQLEPDPHRSARALRRIQRRILRPQSDPGKTSARQ